MELNEEFICIIRKDNCHRNNQELAIQKEKRKRRFFKEKETLIETS